MEVTRSSETYKTTRCHIPEAHNAHFHRCENLNLRTKIILHIFVVINLGS
jgi:hypothetical protein